MMSPRLLSVTICGLALFGCSSELVSDSSPQSDGEFRSASSLGSQRTRDDAPPEVVGASRSGDVFPTGTSGTDVLTAPPVIIGAGGAGGAAGDSPLGDGDLTVLLILDKSGSMAEPWEGNSKWETALDSFFGGLEGVEDRVTIGALLFPLPTGCEVPPLGDASQMHYQSGRSFKETWNARSELYVPHGSTPLGYAFEQAEMAINEADEAGLLDERRFRVVLVTDGEPNCATDPDRLAYLAASWRDRGVEVHTMGLPGSAAAAQLLDYIAGIGGTDEHVAPETSDEAEDTFHVLVR